MTYFEKIINVKTGEETLRPYTKEETDAIEKVAAEAKAQQEIIKKEINTKAIAKTELLTKLGITEDEAKLLLS